MPAVDHRARAALLWPILVQQAHARHPLTYQELSRLTGIHHGALTQALQPVRNFCDGAGLPPLEWLVITRSTGLPADLVGGRDPQRALAIWERIYAFDWRTLPNPFTATDPQEATP
jgi:hypothetical protein